MDPPRYSPPGFFLKKLCTRHTTHATMQTTHSHKTIHKHTTHTHPLTHPSNTHTTHNTHIRHTNTHACAHATHGSAHTYNTHTICTKLPQLHHLSQARHNQKGTCITVYAVHAYTARVIRRQKRKPHSNSFEETQQKHKLQRQNAKLQSRKKPKRWQQLAKKTSLAL